jgi:hypothetical protein
MYPPPAVVGEDQEREGLRSFARNAFVVRDALLDPLGIGRALFVAREGFIQAFGIELQLSGGRWERILLGIQIKIVETGGPFLPILGGSTM